MRSRKGWRHKIRRGHRIGAALDGHIVVGAVRDITGIRAIQLDRRRPGRIGAGIHIDHVRSRQGVVADHVLHAGHRGIGGQAVIGVVPHGGAIHVSVRAGIVDIIGNGAAVAEDETPRRTLDGRIFAGRDAPPGAGGPAIWHAVPDILLRTRQGPAHDIGPGILVVRRIIDVDGVIRRGSHGNPGHGHHAGHLGALPREDRDEIPVRRRLAGLAAPAIHPDVQPPAVGTRFHRPGEGILIARIDQRRRLDVVRPPDADPVTSAHALEMEISAAWIENLGIMLDGIAVLAHGNGPRGQGIIAVGPRRGSAAGLNSAGIGVPLVDIQAVEIALQIRLGHTRQGIEAICIMGRHPDQGVGNPGITTLQQHPDAVRPYRARTHVHGAAAQGGKAHAGIFAPVQGRMREQQIGGDARNRNAVLAIPDRQPFAADEIAAVQGQAVAGPEDGQAAEPDPVGVLQVEAGHIRVGDDVDAAAGGFIGTAEDIDLVIGSLLQVAGIQIANRGLRGRLVDPRIHVNHIARFQVVLVKHFGNPAFGRTRRSPGVRGKANRGAIHIAVGEIVIHIVIDRAVVEHEIELTGGGDIGLDLVLGPPQGQRRGRQAQAVPHHAAQGGRDAIGHAGPRCPIVNRDLQPDGMARRHARGFPVQNHLSGCHAAPVQRDQMQGGVGLGLGGPRGRPIQPDVDPGAV